MDVFVKRAAAPEVGFSVGVTLNKKPTAGLVGLEIEVEGKKLIHGENTPAPWLYHQDGSLRGEENAEYVLNKPVDFSEVGPALDTLWNKLEANNAVIDDSNRTSVHVHLNCQTFQFNRLTSFMAMYFVLEDILTQWCGEHRVGNLFCLRAKDAPAIISSIRRFIKTDGQSRLGDNLHYSGLNAHALNKFGSVEIRTLRGVTDKQVILDWVRILQRLYELSASFTDPREVCAIFSGEGPLAFFDTLLGDTASVVRRDVSWSDQEIRDSLYEGIRLAQDLCYCRDWSVFQGIEVKPDPFRRDPKKLAKRLMAEQGGLDPLAAAINQMTPPAPVIGPLGGLGTSPFQATYAVETVAPNWQPVPAATFLDEFGIEEEDY